MRNPTTCNRSSPESPSELLKRANWALIQPIKPSHHNRPQDRGKYFAHQSFIPWMNNHPLIEMTDVLHLVGPPIVNGKNGLRKPMRKFSPINPTRKWWFWNLVQSPTHCVIPQAPMGRTFIPFPVISLLFIQLWRRKKGFTRRCSWPWSINTIFTWICSKAKRGLFSLLWRNFLRKWSITS